MNLSEFKAWFEGFTENLDGPPGEKAWTKIQAKVKEITDTPATTYPVFVDRYVRPYPSYWPYITWGGASCLNTTGGSGIQAYSNTVARAGDQTGYAQMVSAQNLAQGDGGTAGWNAGDAFRDLGRIDAQSLAA